MKKYILVAFYFLLTSYCIGQEQEQAFSFHDFLQKVKEHHPLAKQADLQTQIGAANLLSARGYFDPKTYANYAQKHFKDINYYKKLEGGVKIPTWFGITVLGGFEDNEGSYLNPENNVPDDGLYFAGVGVTLGQGLFIDERRAALKSAKIYAEGTKQKRRYLINELYLEAAIAYWNWFLAYHQQMVFKEAVDLSYERFKAVKQSAFLGDRPYVDTLEAGIQFQNRTLSFQEAQLNLNNAKAQLNVYLWDEGLVPLELEEFMIPTAIDSTFLEASNPSLKLGMDTLIEQHPLLALNDYEIQQLEVEQRLKAEYIKPKLNLKYQPLLTGIDQEDWNQVNSNNYKFGVEFSFPIFLRKERGELEKNRIKLQEKELEYDNKAAQLRAKVNQALNEWDITLEQAELYQQTTNDYYELLKAERSLFGLGESSLFLVNSRELGYIGTKVKLIQLISKNKLAKSKAYYSLGILDQQNQE